MGTFSITTPVTIATKVVYAAYDYFDGVSDAEVIAALLNAATPAPPAPPGPGGNYLQLGWSSVYGGPVSGVIRFDFNQTDAIISLDGAPAISFNSLPSGFTPLSATLSVAALDNQNAQLYLQFDPLTEGIQHILSAAFVNYTLDYDFIANPSISMLDIINNGFGIRMNFTSGVSTTCVNVFSFTGTYTLAAFSWYIKLTEKVINGQKVNVIADPTEGEDIIQVDDGDTPPEGYELYGTSEDFPTYASIVYYWWISDDFYLTYIFSPMPPGPTWTNYGTVAPVCTNCLTLTLLSNDVLIANASGIYTLSSDKTNDSLYVRTGFSTFVEAIETKIPNPFVKTAFIP